MRACSLALIAALAVGCGAGTDNASEHIDADSWLTRLGVESVVEIDAERHDRESIDLHGTDITDDDLGYLTGFSQIQTLNLNGTRVTDDAVEHLLAISSLKELNLLFTNVTGVGIRELSAHPNLEVIHVWHDQLNADGIPALKEMESLEAIILWVPDAGNEDVELPAAIAEVRRDVVVRVCYWGAIPPGG